MKIDGSAAAPTHPQPISNQGTWDLYTRKGTYLYEKGPICTGQETHVN